MKSSLLIYPFDFKEEQQFNRLCLFKFPTLENTLQHTGQVGGLSLSEMELTSMYSAPLLLILPLIYLFTLLI